MAPFEALFLASAPHSGVGSDRSHLSLVRVVLAAGLPAK